MKCGTQICTNAVETFILSNWNLTSTGTATTGVGQNNLQMNCDNCETEGNLVMNGNFHLGNTGFTSGLAYNEGAGSADEYRVNQYYYQFESPADKSIRVACSSKNCITKLNGKLLWKTFMEKHSTYSSGNG